MACKPGSVQPARKTFLTSLGNHSSGMPVTRHLKQPTRIQCGYTPAGSLFGLAPDGVYHAMNCYQSCGALLPHPFSLAGLQRRLGRSTLCCTFRRLSPPRRYLASYPAEPGLSSIGISVNTDNFPTAIARPTRGGE